MYKVLDLFCGAGGLSLGFAQTQKYSIVAASEINPNARKTFLRNHRIDEDKMYSDVSTINYAELKENAGDIDIVIGGPPCQGFSNANRQKNHMISLNNKLVKQYVRAIKELKPKAFVMENVSMLKSDVHRFFEEETDKEEIEKYQIKLKDEHILLLEEKYMFDDAEKIVQNIDMIDQNLWDNASYYLINVVYKRNKNKEKLLNVMSKYKNKLIDLAERLSCPYFSDSFLIDYTENAM